MHTTEEHRAKRRSNDSEQNESNPSREDGSHGAAGVARFDNSSSGLNMMTPLYKITGPKDFKIHLHKHNTDRNGNNKAGKTILDTEIHKEYLDFPRVYTKREYMKTKNERNVEDQISASNRPMVTSHIYVERQDQEVSNDTMLVNK